jgi:hypothetical protein
MDPNERGGSLKLETVDEIIALRVSDLVQEEALPNKVTVLLGKPEQTPGIQDGYCPYQIKGARSEKV